MGGVSSRGRTEKWRARRTRPSSEAWRAEFSFLRFPPSASCRCLALGPLAGSCRPVNHQEKPWSGSNPHRILRSSGLHRNSPEAVTATTSASASSAIRFTSSLANCATIAESPTSRDTGSATACSSSPPRGPVTMNSIPFMQSGARISNRSLPIIAAASAESGSGRGLWRRRS